jgi:purine-nucleoside phosphorylase
MDRQQERSGRLSDQWRGRVETAVAWLDARGFRGKVGLILGSGLGNFVDHVTDAERVKYGEIPGYTTTSVAEHSGYLVHGSAAGVPVVVMQGRLHPYEGLPWSDLLLPTAVLACLGIDTAVVTNAAGGLNRHYAPGDLMVIRDQLDLHYHDPLRGLLTEATGTASDRQRSVSSGRQPGVSPLFDPALAELLVTAAAETGAPIHVGTYASMWGPAYETKAEIGMLRRAGCDAVGMSTAPETVLLKALGVEPIGLSCITNPARETGQPELSHQDVVAIGRKVRDRMARLLLALLPKLSAESG